MLRSLCQRRAIVVEMLGLPPHRLLPVDAEPGEVLVDRRLELRPAARRVDVLDAQQQAPARRPRHVEIEQRREGVAEMQIAVRARRKAENGWRHAHRASSSSSAKSDDPVIRCACDLNQYRITRCPLLPDDDRPIMTIHIIHTEADLAAGMAALVAQDPRLAPVLRQGRHARRCAAARAATPACARSSAASSFRPPAPPRSGAGCSAAFDPFHHDAVRRSRAPTGSRGSACRGRRSSRSRRSARPSPRGRSTSTRSAAMEADEAHAALTALHGIGPWTADIYLLFCLGNADAWPAGDLALQEAARIAFGLRQRPDAKAMVEARRAVAAVARGGRASVVGLLSRRQAARGRAGARRMRPDEDSPMKRRRRSRMAAELDGPRLEPRGGPARGWWCSCTATAPTATT